MSDDNKPGRPEGDERKAADLMPQIEQLDARISDLTVLYEQYILGVISFAPDKEHNAVKSLIRKLRKAPFKTSATAFKLRVVETRYNTLHTHWQRVLREKESGIYPPDVFKANLREKQALAEARAETSVGKAEKHMQALFDSYRSELERQTGRTQALDFEAFQKSLIQRAKELKQKTGVKKLAFKVVVKDGKVTVQARAKEE